MVSEFKDANSRIICLETIINCMQLTLGNIYAPNREDPSFFHEVNSILGHAQDKLFWQEISIRF